ncbi:Vacuolar amino acid transporter 6 [Komagataella phaffii CBS 7435]|uniref:Vacuolar amino acid transporter 6 n=1 Tax=Komagataella phaffii (strain ATCC 76273 / CBS 7435 / CECT 11047 / NRRL Y-11430 / Wegner 21-1) TaxID=981350 RepID=F2QR35_KOMPC|nr:GQ67_01184T0 [Komagataella phaffii]CAH2447680.1 Vacuolar amino acid transporter, exports aspartate and glutamate from the vacuole [Komagataella phaffii CBS 7435]CCA37863.1 Vacuolar amino acid transporter 6 [Komagataella phaffii CBS 7435]
MTGKSSAFTASLGLLHTLIGAGILAMPYAIRSSGILFGVFLIILSGLASLFGLFLQTKVSQFVTPGHASFFTVAQITYPKASIFFDIAIMIKCFGVGCSYLVVIGDLMPKIVHALVKDSTLAEHPALEARNLWISLFMLIIIPLCYLRNLTSLKYASLVALSSVGYLVVLVVVHLIFPDEAIVRGPIKAVGPTSITEFLGSFPIFVVSYTSQHNAFSLINELRDKSAANMNKFISIAISTAMVLYMVTGICGYLTFGDNIISNIIAMYPQNVSSTVGRIAIVFLVTLSFPLQCHPCRNSLNYIVHFYQTSGKTDLNDEFDEFDDEGEERRPLTEDQEDFTNKSPEGSGPPQIVQDQTDLNDPNLSPIEETPSKPVAVHLSTQRLIILTTIIIALAYSIALSVTSLGLVLSVVGATGSTSISYILPGIFGYKLLGTSAEATWRQRTYKYAALALVAFGITVMVICLTVVLFLNK